jgi:hypothetical protein
MIANCRSGFYLQGTTSCTASFNEDQTSSGVQIAAKTFTLTITAIQLVTSASSTVQSTFHSTTTITEAALETVYAPVFEVRWNDNDSAIIKLLDTSIVTTNSNSPSTTVLSGSSSSIAPTSGSTSYVKKVSGATIAGIVVVVIAFIALIIVILLFWLRKRRKSSRRDSNTWQKAELEAHSRTPVELSGEMEIKEMPNEEKPVELPGCLPSARSIEENETNHTRVGNESLVALARLLDTYEEILDEGCVPR